MTYTDPSPQVGYGGAGERAAGSDRWHIPTVCPRRLRRWGALLGRGKWFQLDTPPKRTHPLDPRIEQHMTYYRTCFYIKCQLDFYAHFVMFNNACGACLLILAWASSSVKILNLLKSHNKNVHDKKGNEATVASSESWLLPSIASVSPRVQLWMCVWAGEGNKNWS